ncbi:MAG: ADP-ribosylglycohydrolase family protein [Myxococcota bacterium]
MARNSMSTDAEARLERARTSLEGLSVGDAFGERFFAHSDRLAELVARRALPRSPWRYTDDTEMALAIVDVLEAHGRVDPDALARRFAHRYARRPGRGYGPGAHRLLPAFGGGADWRVEAPALFRGSGSFGNGGAMRVAPLGAYFADDPERLAQEADVSARVTHAHPEGRAGAIAVSAAAGEAARQGADGETEPRALFDAALAVTPDSEVRDHVETARGLDPEETVTTAVANLGNGSRITAQDTVGFCLWSAARHLEDFEAAMWTTVSAGGDRDTTCAIVGGIVAAFTGREGVPATWLEAREPLESGV